jgi:hypothetical protein
MPIDQRSNLRCVCIRQIVIGSLDDVQVSVGQA